MSEAPPNIRVDKWLWHARFFKTRALCATLIKAGRLRLNEERIAKPAVTVRPGDVLTFPQARDVRVIKVIATSTRRGPAPEAQALYEDLSPPVKKDYVPPNPRFDGKGRPTKKDRRAQRSFDRDGLA